MRYRAVTMVVVIGWIMNGAAGAQEPFDIIMLGQHGSQHGAPLPPMIDYKIGMVAVEPLALGEPVPNAPYTAEIVTEIIQELADGNRIERRTTSVVARDGRGRVRREQQLAAIGPMLPEGDTRMVTISDPVDGVHYALDATRKSATRSRPPVAIGPSDHGPREVMTFTRHLDSPDAADVRTERLGSKQIEGVRADGTRIVHTIPAGAIGNVRPIEVVNERWFSPELRIVVYSRRADPRFGETIYRLTNLVRAEPDPSLFQVPADYTQEEMKPPTFAPKAGVRVKPRL